MEKAENHILLIESNADLANLITASLTNTDYDVTAINVLRKGLLRAMAYSFDLIIINAKLILDDDLDLLRKMKAQPKYDKVPILFIGGVNVKIDHEIFNIAKYTDILKIPFDEEEFRLRIKNLMLLGQLLKGAKSIKEPEKINKQEFKNKGRVLLVEDNHFNQKILGMFLNQLDYEYDLAEDGLQAIDKFEHNDYSTVLMDIIMPGMDGIEATKRIRKMEKGKDKKAKIIAISANDSERNVKTWFNAGMDDFLTKPFTSEGLKEKIN